MSGFFVKLVNMSITAGWVVLAVVILRALLRKIPKWARCLLWLAVGIRLVLPFSFESALSLIPSANTISERVMSGPSFSIDSGIEPIDSTVNELLDTRYFEGVTVPTDTGAVVFTVAAVIWIVGMAGMVLYALVSYLRLRRRVSASLSVGDGVQICDEIESPFILGIFRPRIYLPSSMDGEFKEHVIAHERSHLARRDHWWKPIGYALLTVHWFNPLIWISYILLCRDIELACDERVVREMEAEEKKAYSEALLSVSVPHRAVRVCPLAFGEVGVRERIKSVVNYRKPAFYVIILTVVVLVAAVVFLLSDPVTTTPEEFQLSFGSMSLEELGIVTENEEIASIEICRGDMSFSVYNDEEIEAVQEILEGVRLSKNELSQDRSDERDTTNTIVYLYEDGTEGIKVHFSDDCGSVWVDDGVKPTLSHQVKNPGKIAEMFATDVVKWVYTPALSATWHGFFVVEFDAISAVSYAEYIEVSCTAGQLYDIDGDQTGGVKTDTVMRLDPASKIYWTPTVSEEDDSLRTAHSAEITFRRVYANGTEVTGTLKVERLFDDVENTLIGGVYTARLEGAEGYNLVQRDNSAALISADDFYSTAAYAYAHEVDRILWDADHDGAEEICILSEGPADGDGTFSLTFIKNGVALDHIVCDWTFTQWSVDGYLLCLKKGSSECFTQYSHKTGLITLFMHASAINFDTPAYGSAEYAYMNTLDQVNCDIDEDGSDEECIVSSGRTSGVPSYCITVVKDGKSIAFEHFQFQGLANEISAFTSDDGNHLIFVNGKYYDIEDGMLVRVSLE